MVCAYHVNYKLVPPGKHTVQAGSEAYTARNFSHSPTIYREHAIEYTLTDAVHNRRWAQFVRKVFFLAFFLAEKVSCRKENRKFSQIKMLKYWLRFSAYIYCINIGSWLRTIFLEPCWSSQAHHQFQGEGVGVEESSIFQVVRGKELKKISHVQFGEMISRPPPLFVPINFP